MIVETSKEQVWLPGKRSDQLALVCFPNLVKLLVTIFLYLVL